MNQKLISDWEVQLRDAGFVGEWHLNKMAVFLSFDKYTGDGTYKEIELIITLVADKVLNTQRAWNLPD